MIKIKSGEFLRSVILFGVTALLFLTANFLPLFGDPLWGAALDVLLVGILFLDFAIFSSLIHNIRRDIAFLVFAVAFNILLLGRVYVSWIGYHHKYPDLLEADSLPHLFTALQVVALSLFFSYLAYRLSGPLFYKRESALRERGMGAVRRSPVIPVLRQLSEVVLLIGSVPFLYILFRTVLSVRHGGYLNSFTTTESVPGVISRLSMFFVPSFAVFLATLPNRKQIRLPLFIYGIYMVSSLFTGRRNTLVTEGLMLVIYFVLRDSMLPKEERKLQKRTVVFAGIFGVAAMYFLQLVALVRSGASGTNRGLGEMLVSFFDSQGASFRVVIQTVNHLDLFDRSVSYQYLFYPFEMFVHNNTITRTIFGLQPIVEVQNSIFVQTTHNFAHVITYLVDPARYLSGGGFGTSYIAEAYVAYGVGGAIVISAMIGLIFRFFASMMTRSWVVLASCLIAVKDFVYIPRSFAFMWVTGTFNITYFCFYGALYFAALLLMQVGTHVRPDRVGRPSFALEDSP